MIPFLKHLLQAIFTDELAFRRYGRSALMTLGASGMVFADQIDGILEGHGGLVQGIKIAAVVCAALSLAITAGEKNVKPNLATADEEDTKP